MLNAERLAVSSKVRQRAAAIAEKELNYYVDNFQTLSMQCSMLAGFSYAGLTMSFDSRMVPHAYRLFLYSVLSTLSMVCNLGALWIATMCSIKGPRLGLLGQEQACSWC